MLKYQYPQQQNRQPFSPYTSLKVVEAAQTYLKCDQPNSLKSKSNFLDINPASFMCDIQIAFREHANESAHELGDEAVLVCDVYGDPEPDVYWSVGQRPIEKALSNEPDKYDVSEVRGGVAGPGDRKLASQLYNQQYLSNKTSVLRIKNLQVSDLGAYTCTAEIKGSNNRKSIEYTLTQVRADSLDLP